MKMKTKDSMVIYEQRAVAVAAFWICCAIIGVPTNNKANKNPRALLRIIIAEIKIFYNAIDDCTHNNKRVPNRPPIIIGT